MTIYRLYRENGNRAAFWIQHRNWTNTCGCVVSISGRESGPLPGAPPRHDEAPVVVLLFDIRTGRALHESEGRSAAAATSTTASAPVAALAELAVPQPALDPADRKYVSIAEPSWHATRRNCDRGG